MGCCLKFKFRIFNRLLVISALQHKLNATQKFLHQTQQNKNKKLHLGPQCAEQTGHINQMGRKI